MLLIFMVAQAALVMLLVMPMPNNTVRGKVTQLVANLFANQAVRYVYLSFLAIDIFYFWYVVDALTHPLYDFGLLTPIEIWPCEVRAVMYQRERNAYITGFSLFLGLILNRLVDIQGKLHAMRDQVKSNSVGVPMGQPIATDGKSHFD